MKTMTRLPCFLLCLASAIGASTAEFLRIDGALPAGGDCALFGSWDAATATCVVQDAVIPLGDRLDVASATLLVAGTLTNDGMLVNDGTLLVPGFLNNANDLVNNWTATMVISGTYFSHFMYNFGSLTNEPTGFVDFDFFVENNGPLINRGSARIGTHFFNIPERRIENLGSIEIAATASVGNDGIFIHAGQMDIQGSLDNGAILIEHCDSVLTGNSPTGNASTGAQSMSVSKESLSWCAVPGALDYDVVLGDLDLLHAGGGNFSTATLACLGDAVAGLSVAHSIVPPSGTGVWFLVRANGIASAGFDTVFSSQIGERATEIEAAAGSCP